MWLIRYLSVINWCSEGRAVFFYEKKLNGKWFLRSAPAPVQSSRQLPARTVRSSSRREVPALLGPGLGLGQKQRAGRVITGHPARPNNHSRQPSS